MNRLWLFPDPVQLEGALATVVMPDLIELREAFARARPVVLKLARERLQALNAPRAVRVERPGRGNDS